MKKFYTLLIFIQSIYNLNAQSSFQHLYGNNRNERCQSAYQSGDGGILLNGVTTSFGNGDADGLIVKTDALGNVLWSKTCGTPANEIPTYAAESYDNNMVFIGTTDASTSTDGLLYKTDSAGNFLWAKSFGGFSSEDAVKVIELPDNGYAITGTTESYGSGSGDIYLIRTDENGDTLFTGVYGTSDYESAKSISTTADGGFIICGRTYSMISGALVYRAILSRLDSTGNIVWTKLYGDTLFQEAQSVEQTADGGFIVCGSRDFTSNGNYDILLFKTDSTGNIQWSKTYGGDKGEGSYTVILNEDGTYVVSGYTNSMGYGHRGNDSTNAFLMKTDALGDTLWTRAYGDSLQEEVFLSSKSSDGGYILAGFNDYHNADSSQMLVIKTDIHGFSGCYDYTAHPVIVNDLLVQTSANYFKISGMAWNSVMLTTTSRIITDSTNCLITGLFDITKTNFFSVFPNPAKDRLYVKSLLPHGQTNISSRQTRLSMYSILGEQISIAPVMNSQENYFEINLSAVIPGIYLLEILTEEGKFVQRVIKE